MMLLTAAQLAGAKDADRYVTDALESQGIDPTPSGVVRPEAFAGIASDGRRLDTLLAQPVVTTLTGIGTGLSETQSLAAGFATLEMLLTTQIADAYRQAAGAGTATRKHATMYVRMLTPPSCSRCAILAGAYSWKTAFKRHPRCDCTAVASDREKSRDLTRSPEDYFKSLSHSDQDKVFTRAGAQAIRDGADIGRVVNARRRAAGLTPAQSRTAIPAELRAARGDFKRGRLRADADGRFLTSELSGRKQQVVRPMPETIYAQAKTRDEAIALLKLHNFIYTPR